MTTQRRECTPRQAAAAHEWYDHTLYSRLNDKLSGAIVRIMHRLHEEHLASHVLTQEQWEEVRLPAIRRLVAYELNVCMM